MKERKPSKSFLRYEKSNQPNVEVQVSLLLDLDLVEHFKKVARKSGKKYQYEINQALRKQVFGRNDPKVTEASINLDYLN